jgi:hypothetical protein
MDSQSNLPIQMRLSQVLSTVPAICQQEVLNFALFVRQRELTRQQFQQWDDISDEAAAMLKAEFAEEDQIMAEMILPVYSALRSYAIRLFFGRRAERTFQKITCTSLS